MSWLPVAMMTSLRTVVRIFFCLSIVSSFQGEKDWWETGVFYQIYPRSFKDSNGDGIGDLEGIRQKINYLKDIGVSGFWLSPIFKSPMADFGYDISDYRAISEDFGSMQDFENLLKRAKELDIKVILDFVPNHTSDEHEWFVKSVAGDPEYKDFYVWHPGRTNPNGGRNLPPCNWLSIFGGSAWTWNEKRQAYYFHQFLAKQPDLNFRNEKVKEAMKEVLLFWLDKGVDGFRIDAVPHIYEVDVDASGQYPDEPVSGETEDTNNWGYLTHNYTRDMPETFELLYDWREVLDDYKKKNGGNTRIIMAEYYAPIDIVVKCFGNGQRLGAHIPFNFLLLSNLDGNARAGDFKKYIDMWMTNVPSQFSPNWVLGNHDNSRISTKFGAQLVDAMNVILLALPGASVTYYGDEIGMVDYPAAETYDDRDRVRTPFQWSNSTQAGFTDGPKTWLPIHPGYQTVNVEHQLAAKKSHLLNYRNLTQLKRENVLQNGDFKIQTTNNDNVLLVTRSLGDKMVHAIVNFGQSKISLNLTAIDANLSRKFTYKVVDVNSIEEIGALANAEALSMHGETAVVLYSGSTVLRGMVSLILAMILALFSVAK